MADRRSRWREVEFGGLEIHSDRGDGSWRVRVRGELDLATVSSLETELDGLAGYPLFLDLSGVTFIDSTGLALLIRRADRIVLEARSEEIDRALSVCGLEAHFRFREPEDAVSQAGSPGERLARQREELRHLNQAQEALRAENRELNRHALSLEGDLANALLALDGKDYDGVREVLVRARGELALAVASRESMSVEPAETPRP
jgi:anti-anti-sigma factor